MTAPVATLAKLTRPRPYDAVMRGRLFAALDEARRQPLTFVSGPPGAGKTTLMASYLDARKISGIWYQIDSGDCDPATFFYYLGLGASSLTRRRAQRPPALPLFTPEYLPDLTGFARRFFRELLSRLANGATLTLDNLHELGEESPLLEALSKAFEEVPPGVTVQLLSRSDAPRCLARLRANCALATIGWEQLKLTYEETRDIVVSQEAVDHAVIEALHRRCSGWAAGLRLLLERARSQRTLDQVDDSDSQQGIFDYFATQIFAQASEQTRSILVRLAYLPRITLGAAEHVTGDAGSARLLDYLYRRHLFTDRRVGSVPAYEFHALFREFLQSQAAQLLTPEEHAQVVQRSAEALQAEHSIEDAVKLLIAARDYERAATLVRDASGRLIGQGRRETVLEWLTALPAERVATDPWLLYWRGLALSPVDPKGARQPLEQAYPLAAERQDRRVQLLVAAAMADSYLLEYVNFRPLERWLPILEELIDGEALASPDEQLSALAAVAIAVQIIRGADASVNRCVSRISELLGANASANARLRGCYQILLYAHNISPEAGRRLLPILDPLLENPEASALNRALCSFILAWYCCVSGDYRIGSRAVRRVEEIGAKEGLPLVTRFAAIAGFYLEATEGHVEAAESRLREMERVANPAALYDTGSVSGMRSWFALFNGDAKAAIRHGRVAIDIFDRIGSYMHPIMYRLPIAWGLVQEGDLQAASELAADCRQRCERYYCGFWLPCLDAIDAWVALAHGNRALFEERLRDLFGRARQHQFGHMLAWLPGWMPRLCSEALAADIEADYVKTQIREHAWQPLHETGAWPWPLKIYTLGRFAVLRDDEPLRLSRKAPRTLLRLLKAIVAFGEQNVPEQRLADAIWPELEADAGHRALSVAVRRLRDLLGHPDVVRQRDGKVGLDSQRCWTDVRAFVRMIDAKADAAPRADALELYRGPFLHEEPDARWAIPARERLRAKFLQHLAEEAKDRERSSDFDTAIKWYTRGIEADEIAESFYQGLIRCHLARQRRAEALGAYRRMRQVLSVVLGIEPSVESEALYRTLREPTESSR